MITLSQEDANILRKVMSDVLDREVKKHEVIRDTFKEYREKKDDTFEKKDVTMDELVGCILRYTDESYSYDEIKEIYDAIKLFEKHNL